MALGFFRRRQKMVIVIMVALMVSFLVGWQGCSMIMETDPGKVEIATTRFGDLTRGEFWSAEADLNILNRMGLAGNPWEFGEFYILTRRNGEQAHYAYLLLLHEAEEAGILADSADVDAFFARLGYSGDNYDSFISSLRASSKAWSEARIRQAVRNYVLVTKAFAEFRVNCPPSAQQTAIAFRDMKEQIKLRVVRLKAEDYLQDVPDPNQRRINAHFARYRELFPDQQRRVTEMRFGYREPARAAVRYLFLRGDAIRRISEPTFDMVHDYFKANRNEFVKKVPASAPAPAATQPADADLRDVPMEFAEAKPQIVEKLRAEVAAARMDDLMRFLEETHVPKGATAGDPKQVYAAVRKAVMKPADKALATVLQNVKVTDRPLDEAVARLAEAARLGAICYPWGTFGDDTLLPSVTVSVEADRITLGEALAKVSQQAKWPPEGRPALRWVRCEGFPNVLFCASDDPNGIDLFPVTAGQTGPMTLQELSEHPILGYATVNPAGGASLPQVAFTAEGLAANQQQKPLVAVGKAGPRMYVMGDKPGRLLWRLEAALPARSAMDPNESPELRQRVVRDVKLADAFAKAVEDAGKLKRAGQEIGFDTILSARKLEAVETDFFARRTERMGLPDVPQLGLDSQQLMAYAIPKLFALVPGKDENLAKPKPALGVVPIPIEADVLVVERIGYKPVLLPEYNGFGRIGVAQMIHQGTRQQLELAWFDVRTIMKRVGFAWQQE